MAKKKSIPAAPSTAPKASSTSAVLFPTISTKEYLECRVLLEDQILLIDVREILYFGVIGMLIIR